MSETITLTERERAVFAHMARTLGNGTASHDIIVSNALLHFLDADFRASYKSASPPRVPGASAPIPQVGVQSGPGQPIDLAERMNNLAQQGHRIGYPICDDIAEAAAEIRRLRTQVQTERRAGIEEAAQAAHDAVKRFTAYQSIYPAKVRDVIRALADKPAPSDKGG